MKKTLCSTRAIYNFIVLFITILVPQGFLLGQANNLPDYQKIFGEQYSEAINYLNKNEWITISLLTNKIDPCFAKSIIFPELIRYSYLKDKMEIQALKTLYVQYGQNYANFSIGKFQIKPSFAEQLEKDLKQLNNFQFDTNLKNIDTTQTKQSRLKRVKRLESDKWQVQYLIWFIKLSQERFDKLSLFSESEKLKFLSTAYNCGYHKGYKIIMEVSRNNYFHTNLVSCKHFYNYSDISLFFWNKCLLNSK